MRHGAAWCILTRALALMTVAGGPAAAAETACPLPADPARVAAIVDDLDIALEDGRTLKLVGIDPVRATPSHPGLGEEARRRLEAELAGHDVQVAIVATAPDRWERLAALVSRLRPAIETIPDDGSPVLVNETLIATGLARARPDVTSRPCFATFLAQEQKASIAGVGLWADPYYSILEADDRQSLAGRTGAMALVEGRVRLHDARGRLYLDLGRTPAGLAAVAGPNALKNLARDGQDLHRLAGLRIRVRGFLDDRFGFRIDLSEPGQIEVLKAAKAQGSAEAGDGPGQSAGKDNCEGEFLPFTVVSSRREGGRTGMDTGSRDRGGRTISGTVVAGMVAALCLILAGCSGLIEDKPKVVQASLTVPALAPKTTGIESAATREHKQLVAYFGGEYHAPATEHFLDEVLAKLSTASDTPSQVYKVTILNSPIVNAFALPSGNIYVTRGLLALANDTSEVAAVMAHEIAHVTARHALQRAELEKRSAVISQAADVIDNRERGKTFKNYAQLTLASFSRLQEFEADEIGVKVIARAGFDPFAASRFLVSLEKSTELRQATHPNGSSKPDMMATHPSTPERVAHAVAVARGIGAPGIGESGHDRYLVAITGLLYGDDPAEGFVRGRNFIHPKLGFAFTAPDSFVLENSAQAVLGVTADGNQALRLDRVHVPAETTLQTYIGSGWIDGLQSNSAENIVVNGLPGITATARAETWSFRLAAIRVGAEVYRLTFAAKDLTPDLDRQFREAIDTFRRITPEEVRAIRPLRIDVAAADASDTADTMAARMAVPDHPLETFKVLNGIDTATLEAGRHYKVVSE